MTGRIYLLEGTICIEFDTMHGPYRVATGTILAKTVQPASISVRTTLD